MPPILLGLAEKRAGGLSKAQALVCNTGLAPDRPPRNMVPIATMFLTTNQKHTSAWGSPFAVFTTFSAACSVVPPQSPKTNPVIPSLTQGKKVRGESAVLAPNSAASVILSGVSAPRSEALTQSKDPYRAVPAFERTNADNAPHTPRCKTDASPPTHVSVSQADARHRQGLVRDSAPVRPALH